MAAKRSPKRGARLSRTKSSGKKSARSNSAGQILRSNRPNKASDRRVETELQLKKRNGDIIATRLDSSPMTSSMRDGARLYQTAIVDLTERKRFEETIQRSEERYRALFDLVPVAVYVCDAAGIIGAINRRASELWGRDPTGNGDKSRFCGSYKMFYPDGRPMPHDE